MLARFERPLRVQRDGSGRDGDHDLAPERLLGARGNACTDALRDERATALVEVPDERCDPVRDQHPRRLRAVRAAAHDGVGGGLRAAESVGGDDRRRGRPECRHRRGVQRCEKATVVGVGQEDEPGDRRETTRRVARE